MTDSTPSTVADGRRDRPHDLDTKVVMRACGSGCAYEDLETGGINGGPEHRTPYQEALAWIEKHPHAGSGIRLAKLILSLYNDKCGYSIRECLDSMDEERQRLALRIVQHFAKHGEDAELVLAGERVVIIHPRLLDLGEASYRAKWALERRWQAARDNSA
jgi:hypothetical protein